MMDWLYEELDQEESDGVEAHLDRCADCSRELSSLKETRAAFRELPEEEPPPALSSILLHEAASRAPAARARAKTALGEEEPGFFSKLLAVFRPLVLHPAATAAATLVLVAGVVGTLYVKQGSHEIASPEASSRAEAPAPAEEAEPIAEPESEAVAMEEGALEQSVEFQADSEESADRGYAADLLEGEGLEELEAKVSDRSDSKKAETGTAPPPPPEPRRTRIKADRSPGMSTQTAKKNKARRKLRQRAPSTNAVTGADPLIAGESAPAGSSGATGGLGLADGRADLDAAEEDKDEERQAYRPYRQREIRWAQTQSKRLSQAVADKQCRRAAEIANDILDRNPEYYTSEVKGSKAVKQCRWYVQKERRARVAKRRRAQKAKAAAAKEGGGGKTTKARAAPARDEAAAEPTSAD